MNQKLKSQTGIKLTTWLACKRIRVVRGFANRRLSSLKTGKHLPDLEEISILNFETGIPIEDLFNPQNFHYVLRDNNQIERIYQ